MSEKPDYVYGHVIEALSGGLYPNKLDVVREYIQNSYDAIREKIKLERDEKKREDIKENSRIDITIKAGSLFIRDNAIGMDFETLSEYRKIGFSKKPYGEYAGWRGIGKAAGLSICEKLIVTTSKGLGEIYILEFNAKSMIDEVYRLRGGSENIPFDTLIEKYSEIKTVMDNTEPFTMVELCKIKSEASELLNKDKLVSHLSLVAPIPFNPQFIYGKKIEKELGQYLDDYNPVKIFVEGEQIFKPYLHEWIEIGTEDNPKTESIDEPDFRPIYDENHEMIAFCWYCLHSTTGQIKIPIRVSGPEVVEAGGLVYRIDDIKIGDAYLTRQTLWKTTPERSLWALGEIHILDEHVEPTSDRNGFLDNYGRLNLYDNSRVIANEINKRAKKVSDETTAERKINEVSERLGEISKEVAEKSVHKELIGSYIHQVHSIMDEAESRKPKTPEQELKEKADSVISTSKVILEQLESAMKGDESQETIVKDVTKNLKFTEESIEVYNSIMSVIKSYFYNTPDILEELIKKITEVIEDKFTIQ